METPSLRIRVIVTGLVTVTVLLMALSTFVYLNLRDELNSNLDHTLDVRAELAGEFAATMPVTQLRDRLATAGVPALIVTADGDVLTSDPAAPRVQGGPPADPDTLPAPLASREAELPDGGTVTVYASRAGVDAILQRVLLLEFAGSVVAIGLAVLLLSRFSRVILGRLDHVVGVARRIAAGRTGERLNPDRPDTELGRLAHAFDEMLEALETALQESQTAEARSRRFLADAAHQLRTPAAGIRASLETLIEDPSPEERDRLVGHLLHETARLGRLLDQLLRMAHLDRSGELDLRRVDLAPIIRAETERAASLAPSLEVEVSLPQQPVVMQGDPDGLAESIANLLDNARRHAATSIQVTVVTTLRTVRIRVHDDGPGVAAGDESRIFERFVTLDEHKGSGLGLPIARGVARQHGGDLVWDGQDFVLRLPLNGARSRQEVPLRTPVE